METIVVLAEAAGPASVTSELFGMLGQNPAMI